MQPSLTLAWLVVAGAIAVACALALWADLYFADVPRLPMQFGLDGSVNWTAPRRIGLAVAPLVGAAALISVLVAQTYDGDATGAVRHAAMTGAVVVAAELFYLFLLVRHFAAR